MTSAMPHRRAYYNVNASPLVLLLFTIVGIKSVTMASCPSVCQCANSTSQIICQDSELQEIPRNLPQSINTLDMSGNQLHVVNVDSLALLRHIVNLNLKKNEISTIQDGSFERLDSLQTLDLSENQLQSVHQRTFTGAQRLLHLDLSSNNLEHVDGAFAEMTELSRLDLRNNRIQRITQFTFRDLENLRYLLLTNNEINHIDRKAFKNNKKLMYLVLKGNPIHRVPKFEFNSGFLSYVDLSECGLKKIPRGLPNSIRYLQLRRNNMTTIDNHSFDDCPYVSILVLDENGIETIEANTFKHMTYLQQLWLNGNNLTEVPQPLPQTLQRILMDQNRIQSVTDIFPEGSQLHTLSFMGNNISYVAHDAFLKLSELKSLDLSNNQIAHVYGNTYINSAKLKTLQLSKNPIKYFHSHAFHGTDTLKTLSIAYNPSNVSMHPDIFQDMGKLKKLDLDSSPGLVRSILSSSTFLSDLSSVEDLSMQSCELSTLRGDFPEFFPGLTVLHLSSGRWHCDTRLLWLRNWLLGTSVHIEAKDDITCFTPHQVNGRSLTSLSDDEFEQATTPQYTTTTTTVALTTFPPSTTTTTHKITDVVVEEKTTTTAAKSSTDTPYAEEGEGEEDVKGSDSSFDDDDKYDDYGIDFDKFFKGDPYYSLKTANRNTSDNSTSKVLTWEELLSRNFPPSRENEQSSSPPDSWQTKYKDYDPDLDIRTLFGLSTPDPLSSKQDSGDEGLRQDTITVIVVVTTIATVIIAVILISAIVYLSKKQRTRKSNKREPYQNGIKLKHRNDVLYFMPANGDQNGGAEKAESTTESVKSAKSTRSVKTNGSATKEGMTLIPGRDINHEGPHRVYRWEEF